MEQPAGSDTWERTTTVARKTSVERAYKGAREVFLAAGVDPEQAVRDALAVPISLHCWQGDDVTGFEHLGRGAPGGGLAVTGNYPGRARTPGELRRDIETVMRLIPGVYRVNLHACYADFGEGPAVDRDALTVRQFRSWIDWARDQHFGLDFNPTFFAHPKAADGNTLSHADPGIREFWIEHGRRCRTIAAAMGAELGSSVLNNFWVPDGSKDTPADRLAPRRRLADSLDAVFRRRFKPEQTVESVESKLFGVGCESYTVGSHEFYMGYAVSRRKHLCLDAGHFHPTETIADKLSALCDVVPGLALHVSRPVRWDSDHVVTLTDELLAIAQELVFNGLLERTRIGLDYFDASINRIAAWVIGARNARKALLMALLTPVERLREAEAGGDLTLRLALQEEFRMLPFGAVWDWACLGDGRPAGTDWIRVVKAYEKSDLTRRA